MHDEANGDVNQNSSGEIGEEVERCCKGGGVLDFLEVEGGEKFDGVADAIRKGDHDAC